MESGIVIDTNKLKSIEKSLENDVKLVEERFANINNIMKPISDNSDVWKGKTSSKVYEKFAVLSKNFPVITEQLNSYVEYLKCVVDAYEQADETVNTSIDSNNDSLTV